jgi:hypothetical protein
MIQNNRQPEAADESKGEFASLGSIRHCDEGLDGAMFQGREEVTHRDSGGLE